MVEILMIAVFLMIPGIIAAVLVKRISNAKMPPVFGQEERDERGYEK